MPFVPGLILIVLRWVVTSVCMQMVHIIGMAAIIMGVITNLVVKLLPNASIPLG